MRNRAFWRAGSLMLSLALIPACDNDHDDAAATALVIFVGNEGNGNILALNNVGAGGLFLATGAGAPFTHLGLAYQPSTGDLFYSSKDGDGVIYRVSSAGVETTFASMRPAGGGLAASDLAFSPVTGRLHAISRGATNKIISFDAAGAGTEIHDTGNGNALFGLAINALGEVFYSDFTSHEVRQVTGPTTSALIAGPADGLNAPRGLAFDPQGRLLVASGGTTQVYRFTPFGPRIVLIDAADGLATVADVACDPVTGDIYVTGAPGSPALYRFDSAGAPVGAQPIATAGLANPRALALSR
ncbi:MAG TPA: hypothetical protein VJB14_15810 [Planctomycetota bacterium]|nr:hypothetical protein [Planctomycetota bacterium]